MLNFEEVKSNLGDTIWRAKVPGGWLVLVTSEVVHFTEYGQQSGFDWRSSCAYVPDPLGTWEG